MVKKKTEKVKTDKKMDCYDVIAHLMTSYIINFIL